MSYFQSIIDRGGGIVTCGEHLGVFIATADCAAKTPPGWAFVDVATATEPHLREVVEQVTLGRRVWPERENGERPTGVKVRRV